MMRCYHNAWAVPDACFTKALWPLSPIYLGAEMKIKRAGVAQPLYSSLSSLQPWPTMVSWLLMICTCFELSPVFVHLYKFPCSALDCKALFVLSFSAKPLIHVCSAWVLTWPHIKFWICCCFFNKIPAHIQAVCFQDRTLFHQHGYSILKLVSPPPLLKASSSENTTSI